MTNSEYSRRYRAVRSEGAKITIEAKRGYLKMLEKEIKPVLTVIRGLKKGKLESADREQINNALDTKALAAGTRAEVDKAIQSGIKYQAQIDIDYIWEAVQEARASGKLGHGEVERPFKAIIQGAVARNASMTIFEAVANKENRTNFTKRVLKYDLSSSIWKSVRKVQDEILTLIEGGLNQGRDGKQIALDLQEYIKRGKEAVIGRWGKLVPGTAEYSRRLGSGIDYRALRLVRSEMYSSLQAGAVECAKRNPANTGRVKWMLQSGREDWPCECQSIATEGPYKLDEVPSYPHSNCACTLEPEIIEHDEFIKMLTDYVSGEDTEGARKITAWQKEYSLQAE